MTRKKIRSGQPLPRVDIPGGYNLAEPGRTPLGQASASREFKPDYTYVVKDLKRIVVLAGSLIASLIVLSFFWQ